jgi:hypothetical protein
MVKTIVGSFDSFNEAHQVANDLRAAGFLDSDISIVANNAAGDYREDSRVAVAKDSDTSATAKGAVTGAVVGGGAGLAASLAGLAIPGIGPIGGLVDLGVPETDAQYYAEAVRRGGALVTVRTDEARAGEVTDILRQHGAVDIEGRVERWRETGWERFDQDAPPYTPEQIQRDRAMY